MIVFVAIFLNETKHLLLQRKRGERSAACGSKNYILKLSLF